MAHVSGGVSCDATRVPLATRGETGEARRAAMMGEGWTPLETRRNGLATVDRAGNGNRTTIESLGDKNGTRKVEI